MNSELFIKNLQKLITEHGYTLQDVADKTGLTSSTISKYINGHMVPKNKNLLALAKVFSISVSELMGEEEKRPHIQLLEKLIEETEKGTLLWEQTEHNIALNQEFGNAEYNAINSKGTRYIFYIFIAHGNTNYAIRIFKNDRLIFELNTDLETCIEKNKRFFDDRETIITLQNLKDVIFNPNHNIYTNTITELISEF